MPPASTGSVAPIAAAGTHNAANAARTRAVGDASGGSDGRIVATARPVAPTVASSSAYVRSELPARPATYGDNPLPRPSPAMNADSTTVVAHTLLPKTSPARWRNTTSNTRPAAPET